MRPKKIRNFIFKRIGSEPPKRPVTVPNITITVYVYIFNSFTFCVFCFTVRARMRILALFTDRKVHANAIQSHEELVLTGTTLIPYYILCSVFVSYIPPPERSLIHFIFNIEWTERWMDRQKGNIQFVG